jgi:predicted transcriptional regulator
MSAHELSVVLQSNMAITRKQAEVLVGKGLLVSFSREDELVYTITQAGKTFVHDLRLMLGEKE